jgi:hypothetical protein
MLWRVRFVPIADLNWRTLMLWYTSRIGPEKDWEDAMNRFFVASAIAVAGIAPAFAQATVKYGMEWYVVLDTTTKKCTVETNKPTVATAKLVENGIFKTKADAEIGTKNLKACSGA